MDNDLKMLLSSKKNILEEIKQTTCEIGKAFEEEDIEQALKLLKLRKKQMDEVDGLDGKALSACSGDSATLLRNIETDGELKNIFEDIRVILKEIKEKDGENIKKAEMLKAQLSGDIADLKHTKRALKGYGVIETRQSRFGAFIDTKK
ncbi:MAG: hypothetical protein PWQ97_1559 [Tepidanaerobacteraceae bacterium]|nr:hypothetical protein [Tepidanaerobacteraceae bacterium]